MRAQQKGQFDGCSGTEHLSHRTGANNFTEKTPTPPLLQSRSDQSIGLTNRLMIKAQQQKSGGDHWVDRRGAGETCGEAGSGENEDEIK